MRPLGIILAIFILLYGARMLVTSAQAAITGRVLMRRGLRIFWYPAPSRAEAVKVALRDGLMGALLMLLGIVMIL
ncbi:hypothetical protein QUF63_06250 [Anaerolineales bacterium HSG25]|nr:hypothetical protein [Anaerolineales bacterium HSG25]